MVLETTASGVTELSFSGFLLFMQPIHLAIGVVEGLVTAAVVLFVHEAEPELLARSPGRRPRRGLRLRPVLIGFAVAALVAGGGALVVRLDASRRPGVVDRQGDGQRTGTRDRLLRPRRRRDAQEKTAILPDYGTKDGGAQEGTAAGRTGGGSTAADTSLAGVVGALIVLAVAGALGFALRRRSAARTGSRA